MSALASCRCQRHRASTPAAWKNQVQTPQTTASCAVAACARPRPSRHVFQENQCGCLQRGCRNPQGCLMLSSCEKRRQRRTRRHTKALSPTQRYWQRSPRSRAQRWSGPGHILLKQQGSLRALPPGRHRQPPCILGQYREKAGHCRWATPRGSRWDWLVVQEPRPVPCKWAQQAQVLPASPHPGPGGLRAPRSTSRPHARGPRPPAPGSGPDCDQTPWTSGVQPCETALNAAAAHPAKRHLRKSCLKRLQRVCPAGDSRVREPPRQVPVREVTRSCLQPPLTTCRRPAAACRSIRPLVPLAPQARRQGLRSPGERARASNKVISLWPTANQSKWKDLRGKATKAA